MSRDKIPIHLSSVGVGKGSPRPQDDPKFLTSILESVFSGVMAFRSMRDPSGDIEDFLCVFLNSGAERIIGRSRESILDRSICKGLPSLANPERMEGYRRAVDRVERVESSFETHQGPNQRCYRTAASKLGDGFLLTFLETGGEARAELKFDSVLESPLDPVALLGPSGYPIRLSPAWERLLGVSPVEMKASALAAIIHPEDRRAVASELPPNRSHDRCGQFDARFRARGGSYRHLSITLVPLAGGLTCCYARDITAMRQAETEIRDQATRADDSVRFLGDAIQSLPVAVVVYDRGDRLVICNDRHRELFPYLPPLEQLRGRRFEDLLRLGADNGYVIGSAGPADPDLWIGERLDRHRHPPLRPVEETLPDGRVLLMQETRTREGGTVAIRIDISAQKRAEQRLLDAIESIHEGFALWDADDRLVVCNSRYRDLYPRVADTLNPGVRFEHVMRKSVESGQFRLEGTPDEWLRTRLQQHREASGFIEQHLACGQIVRVTERRTAEGGVVGLRTDITNIKRRERELVRLSRIDSLTGALNRRHFFEVAQREFRRTRRYCKPLSILVLDIDRFKSINDSHGHSAGDRCLAQFADLARRQLRGVDILGRTGGEEFVVLLPETDVAAATLAAERLRAAVAESPVELEGNVVRMTASVGVCALGDAHHSIETAMQLADRAMYEAKRGGRNRVVVSEGSA